MKIDLANVVDVLGEDNPVIVSALDESRRAEQELTDWLDRYPDTMNGWKHVQSARRRLRREIAQAEYTMKHAANCKLAALGNKRMAGTRRDPLSRLDLTNKREK